MALILAFTIGLIVTPLSIRLAHRTGALDRPGDLKVQEQPVPHLGGLAVFMAMSVLMLGTRPLLVIPIGCALLLGVVDDMADLPVYIRISIEVAIGIAVATIEPGRGLASFIFAVLLTVGLINAMNLLDGLDAVAAGVATASALGFGFILSGDYRVLAFALAGALLALLVWNRPPARVYLGDGGSYVIGATLAVLLGEAFRMPHSGSLRSGAILLVAVPIADTTVAIVRRYRAGQPLLQGDRGHIYDQLVDRGASKSESALTFIAAQVILAAVAVAIVGLPSVAAAGVVFVVVVSIGGPVLVSFTSPPP